MTDKQLNKVRVRFAPSPTGHLHIGTARTALFNYIFIKSQNGKFILRIEDTDLERSDVKWEKEIIEGLKWLGIEWDEFYRQSERFNIYKKYLEKLLDEDKVYYCFCTKEEIEAQKQEQTSIGKPAMYSGKCRSLSKQKISENLKNGQPFTIRFKTPPDIKIVFQDLARKKIEFDSNLISDFIISKGLDNPLYNFVVVIDDYEMEISHIIRGEDHISNTPKQILLQEALGFPTPKYAHLPLILGEDRSKLSKRHGATAVYEYKKMGYLPEALTNFIAFLGWNPGTEREIYNINSLIKEFSLDKIQKGGAIFNIKRLNFLNSFYIRQKPLNKLTELCIPYLIDAQLIVPKSDEGQIIADWGHLPLEMLGYMAMETKEKLSFNYLKQIIGIYQERLRILSEIPELCDYFFKEKLEYDRGLLKWKDMSDSEIAEVLDKLENILSKISTENFNKENLEKILIAEAEAVGDRGKLLWPLRVALCGKKASAGPFEIAEILGKEKTLTRIIEAKRIAKK
ncbi:glutamate--tRNA ligase [Candidatus Parcubacteria bacterium]|nr:glutamate--tRNA ligase [Candidatus Parcubacteria bacterium]